MFRTKGFHELSEEALALLLQSDKLMMDELEIVVAVREWATVNSVRQTFFNEFLCHGAIFGRCDCGIM